MEEGCSERYRMMGSAYKGVAEKVQGQATARQLRQIAWIAQST